MTVKPVVPRAQARADAESAIDYYLAEGAPDAALGFVDALEQAYTYLSRNAGTGSPRYGHELGVMGLRSWPLSTYPFLLFYLEHDEHIDIWRVLHTRRDIPVRMAAPDSP